MNDFLNPKSMITPGMAGALVMFLSNAICFQFPEIAPRWAALLLSFVLGGGLIAAAEAKQAQEQRQALEAQRAQEADKATQAAKQNAKRFFKEW